MISKNVAKTLWWLSLKILFIIIDRQLLLNWDFINADSAKYLEYGRDSATEHIIILIKNITGGRIFGGHPNFQKKILNCCMLGNKNGS